MYSIVRQAVVSSLLVDDIFCSLLSNGPSVSLHLALCQFSSVSVDICYNVDISTNVNWNEVWHTLLTGNNGEVWVLGRVLFDLPYSLGP